MSEATPTSANRRRAPLEWAARRRTLSIRLGSVGLLLLFGGAIAILVYPGVALFLVGLMVLGIALLLVAFSFARPPVEKIGRTSR